MTDASAEGQTKANTHKTSLRSGKIRCLQEAKLYARLVPVNKDTNFRISKPSQGDRSGFAHLAYLYC